MPNPYLTLIILNFLEIINIFKSIYWHVISPFLQALRKASDQRHMESEDAAEGERKEAEMKLESLTSIVKMFELKAKNSQEQSEYILEV